MVSRALALFAAALFAQVALAAKPPIFSDQNGAIRGYDPVAYFTERAPTKGYGGYCAYGVANGYAPAIDPRAWSIVDGRLYLNYNLPTRALWEKDIPGYIRKADANWPEVLKR